MNSTIYIVIDHSADRFHPFQHSFFCRIISLIIQINVLQSMHNEVISSSDITEEMYFSIISQDSQIHTKKNGTCLTKRKEIQYYGHTLHCRSYVAYFHLTKLLCYNKVTKLLCYNKVISVEQLLFRTLPSVVLINTE